MQSETAEGGKKDKEFEKKENLKTRELKKKKDGRKGK